MEVVQLNGIKRFIVYSGSKASLTAGDLEDADQVVRVTGEESRAVRRPSERQARGGVLVDVGLDGVNLHLALKIPDDDLGA